MIETLFIIEFLIFLFGFLYIFNKEKIFGMYYLFLFIYGIFAQAGYIYIPELSILINAYFGEDIWIPATQLIISSLLSIAALFFLFWRRIITLMPLTFSIKIQRLIFLEKFAVILIGCIAFFQIFYLIFNFHDINWYTNQDEDFHLGKSTFGLFLFFFKFSVAVNIVLYTIILDKLGKYPRYVYKILLLGHFLIFLTTAFRLGNRTDVLALSLGVMTYHLYREAFNYRNITKIITSILALSGILYYIEVTRYHDDGVQLDFWTSLIAKDWYAPAHMLFAVIKYEVINPAEVLISNFSNSLIMIGHPYLQFNITEIFNPGVASRSAGYAFYIFTEGYMFMGQLGFIYNAVLIIFGLAFWKKFASTKNKIFNNFLLGLMGCMLANMVRGQGSYFIKYFYTFVLPGAFLYAMLSGQSLRLKIARISR